MTGIRRAGHSPIPARSPGFGGFWPALLSLRGAVAFASVALVCVSMVKFIGPSESGHDGNDRSIAIVASGSELIEQTAELMDGNRLLNLSQKLDQPLEREIRLVLSDAKAAVQQLAANFIPDHHISNP